MKKSLKQFIFEKMEKDGYVLDGELAKFLEKEPNFYIAEVYKKEYVNLKNAKETFKDFESNKNTIIRHGRRCYLLRDKMWENMVWRVIPKSYFNYLKDKGVEIV